MVGKVELDSTFPIIQTVCRRSPQTPGTYVSIPIGNLSQTVADHMQTRLKHCFQFLLGLTIVPRGNKNNTSAKFWGKNKECLVFSKVAHYVCLLPYMIAELSTSTE